MKPATRHLEIGIGTGDRLKHTVAQARFGVVVGIDKKKGAKRIPGAKLVLGDAGEAEKYLRNALRRRQRFDNINSEYVFDSLVPEPDVGAMLFGGRANPALRGKVVRGAGGFDTIISEIRGRDRLREAKVGAILPLVEKALSRNGTLRLETTKRFAARNARWLRTHGFQTTVKKMKPEKVVSKSGKRYLARAQGGELDVHPYEIIATKGP